jgi:hypothetical protein
MIKKSRKPPATKPKSAALVGRALKECLREGHSVELEGLGVFLAGSRQFVPIPGPRVFIAYAVEDLEMATRLYNDLLAAGMSPWLDRKKLLPGQAWTRCIDRAIENSDFFVACFSTASAFKKGQFPYEVRHALRCADRMPLDDVFVMPVRLNECQMPRTIASQTQYVDLFPNWFAGLNRLVRSIREQTLVRLNRQTAA